MLNTNYLNNEIEFLDILSVISFIIGLKNYNESLSQRNKQDIMHNFNQDIRYLLKEIQNHLIEQDKKINRIMEKLDIKE